MEAEDPHIELFFYILNFLDITYSVWCTTKCINCRILPKNRLHILLLP